METKSFSSNVDGRIRAISNDLDLMEAPPIHQKRLVTFFNHFIVTMVDFLNNFSNSCSHRLFMFDRKISKIEAELRLLEIKLNSIPGFEEEKPQAVVAVAKTTVSGELPETGEKPAPETKEEEEAHTVPKQEKDDEEPPVVDPVIAKYIKMAHLGVPVPAVKLKMKSEGVDPELLKM